MNTHKIFKMLALALGLIGLVFFALIFVMDISEGKNEGLVGAYIAVSYVAMALAFVSVIYYIFKNLSSLSPEGRKKLLKYAGATIIIFILSLVLANGDEVKLKDGGIISSTESRFIGAGLNMFYFLAFASVVVLFWANISKSKK